MLRLASIFTALLALVLVGCGSSTKSANPPSRGVLRVDLLAHGGPTVIEVQAPPAVRAAGGRRLAEFRLGRRVTAESGCLACHKIGDNGNRGPGPNLTYAGSRLSSARIERALLHPTAPMPSFSHLPPAKLKAMVTFLTLLRR